MSARPVGLVLHDLSFRYGPRHDPIIEDLNHEFARGSMTALTGPSGSGKSTLLYVAGLMVRPTAGEVLLAGEGTAHLRDGARAALRADRFGFVFQDAVLDPSRTVLDNVIETTLYRGSNRNRAAERAGQLLTRFGVAHRAKHRPGEISGGQAQRIALCRALLHAPDFILADEPTGNLDAESTAVVVNALREEAERGATVLIATHESRVVFDCDEILAVGQPVGQSS